MSEPYVRGVGQHAPAVSLIGSTPPSNSELIASMFGVVIFWGAVMLIVHLARVAKQR